MDSTMSVPRRFASSALSSSAPAPSVLPPGGPPGEGLEGQPVRRARGRRRGPVRPGAGAAGGAELERGALGGAEAGPLAGAGA